MWTIWNRHHDNFVQFPCLAGRHPATVAGSWPAARYTVRRDRAVVVPRARRNPRQHRYPRPARGCRCPWSSARRLPIRHFQNAIMSIHGSSRCVADAQLPNPDAPVCRAGRHLASSRKPSETRRSTSSTSVRSRMSRMTTASR